MSRISKIQRKTTETEVSIEINLDGSGKTDIKTSIPFLDHMFHLFAKHGFFDLCVQSRGEIGRAHV